MLILNTRSCILVTVETRKTKTELLHPRSNKGTCTRTDRHSELVLIWMIGTHDSCVLKHHRLPPPPTPIYTLVNQHGNEKSPSTKGNNNEIHFRKVHFSAMLVYQSVHIYFIFISAESLPGWWRRLGVNPKDPGEIEEGEDRSSSFGRNKLGVSWRGNSSLQNPPFFFVSWKIWRETPSIFPGIANYV